jgi:hypothetical protein
MFEGEPGSVRPSCDDLDLRRRVTDAIEGLIDPELWNRQIAVQEVELQCISDFVDRVKNLPQTSL